MDRLTTDTPSGNFETMLNFVYGKDGWAYIRHDGEREDVMLTDWAKRQCLLRGCDEVLAETAEDIDQRLCDCMMEAPICPIALAYCFASQAVHLRSRLKMYEDAVPLERAQELAQAEKDGRLVVLDEDVILAMSAGARAILNNKRLQGVTYVYDCFGEFGGPKEISYLKAAEILYRIGSTDLAFQEAEAALKKREEAHEREGV